MTNGLLKHIDSLNFKGEGMKGKVRKYRGYNKEQGWVYGFLLITEDGWFIVNTDIIWLQENNFPGLEKRFEVDPLTVGQEIDFSSKDGKPLFEFDIVDLVLPKTPSKEQEVIRGVIEYDESCASYRVKVYESFQDFKDNMVYDSQPLHGDVECYLVGNVYENPELVKLNEVDAAINFLEEAVKSAQEYIKKTIEEKKKNRNKKIKATTITYETLGEIVKRHNKKDKKHDGNS